MIRLSLRLIKKYGKSGSVFPSERDLAEKFQVSRMTLRQAITLLVEEGVLERRVGSGTFITSTRVQRKKCEAQPVLQKIMKIARQGTF